MQAELKARQAILQAELAQIEAELGQVRICLCIDSLGSYLTSLLLYFVLRALMPVLCQSPTTTTTL